MNHQHIKDVELAERYLMGRLPAEDIAEFEAHFVDCHECVNHLETIRAFLDGLRVVASETAAQRIEPDRRYSAPALMRYRWSLAFAASVILLAFGGATIYQLRQSRAAVEQVRISAAEWQRRYENESESRSVAERENADSERKLRTEIAQLRAELETGAPGSSQIPPRIYTLTSTRGASSSGTITELNLSGRPRSIIFVIPLEGETGYADYRIKIENERGQSIWQSGSMKPNDHGSLSVRPNPRLFRNGPYTVTVEGISANKTSAIVGRYSLSVNKSD